MVLINGGDAQRCSYPRSERNYDSLASDATSRVGQGRCERLVEKPIIQIDWHVELRGPVSDRPQPHCERKQSRVSGEVARDKEERLPIAVANISPAKDRVIKMADHCRHRLKRKERPPKGRPEGPKRLDDESIDHLKSCGLGSCSRNATAAS
jgi:hypothetical protein